MMSETQQGEMTALLSSKHQMERRSKYSGIATSLACIFALMALVMIRDDPIPFSNRTKNIISMVNDPSSRIFPSSFLWGASTSSYQIEGAAFEGGRGPSIWDSWCAQSKDHCNGDSGNVTDDHYHNWQKDVELMSIMGLRAYRFSISWSRILPVGIADGAESGDHRHSNTTGINYDGVQFYNNLIDALVSKGIEPFVTLYHWDLPQALQDKYGGWENRAIIEDFANYARLCFQLFGDRVKYWITINEGWTVAIGGYEDISKAPGLTRNPYLVGHHLLLAHAKAVRVYREEGYSNWHLHSFSNKTGMIGISNSGDYRFPADPMSKDDSDAALRAMEFQMGWMTDPIWFGDYPMSMKILLGKRLPRFTDEEKSFLEGSADFIGLNHYTSKLASKPDGTKCTHGGYWADQCVNLSDNPSWNKSVMGWSIVPDGAREMLLWINKRYNHPLIFVTENGMATEEPDLEHSINDQSRVNFLESYIRGFGEALEKGVNLGGYFAWSLMDNFEWEYGFSIRFGLIHVNYDTLVRTPKKSAEWYKTTIQMNGTNIFMRDSER